MPDLNSTSTGQSPDQEGKIDTTLTQVATGAVDGFSSMARASGGGIDIVEGATVWHSPSSIMVFNAAGLFSPELMTQLTLDAVALYYRDQARPYSVLTLDGLVPGSTGTLNGLGYTQIDAMPAMWLDSIDLYLQETSVPLDHAIEVKQVETTSEMALFRSVLSSIFGMHAREVELILTPTAFNTPHVKHYLATGNGTALAVASVVMGAGIAGIWNVGTLEQYRRQGVALRVMRHALSKATEEGCRASMLLASRDGVPLYEHMGYSTVSTLRVFVPGGTELR